MILMQGGLYEIKVTLAPKRGSLFRFCRAFFLKNHGVSTNVKEPVSLKLSEYDIFISHNNHGRWYIKVL